MPILGHRVVITISPQTAAWTFGDGQRDEHGRLGNPYTERVPCRTKQCPSYYFSHEYRHSGNVQLIATVSWKAEYTVDGGGTQQAGLVPGPQARADLTVHEARSLLVANPGDH